MPEIIGKLWRKVKKSLVNILKDGTVEDEIVDEMVNESKGTETRRVPGLDCPQCGFRIQLSVAMLLSGEPVLCPACDLKLSVDREESQACLNELRKVCAAIQKAEEAKNMYSGI